MCAHKVTEPRTRGSQIEALLTWVGGGERRELDEHHERSAHAIAGVVVKLGPPSRNSRRDALTHEHSGHVIQLAQITQSMFVCNLNREQVLINAPGSGSVLGSQPGGRIRDSSRHADV